MNRLRICLATSEIYPFSKAGGLADVSAALGRYLSLAGHDIRVFSPLYATIDSDKHLMIPVEFMQNVPLHLAGATHYYSLYTALLPGTDQWAYFVHCPEFYDRYGIYTNDVDEHLRFMVLCHAIFQSCQRMGWSPQILHCNDWPTAPVTLLLRAVYTWDSLFSETKSVLTIHNIGYQGVFSADIWATVVPEHRRYLLHQDDLRLGMINFLKTGLLHADVLTTVSPTYAREIQTPEFSAGLDAVLSLRESELFGILNGVDYEDWSPQKDPFIPVNYSAQNPVAGKRANKEILLKRMGLPFREGVPVIGTVSRLVAQKGFELLFESFPQLLAQREFQFVLVGTGERHYWDFFVWLQAHFPSQVAFYSGYSDEMAHLVEAGSDMFLMPSKYEPCGLNQMYSLKYGTVPIVRKTGGLADTVQLFDPETLEGTGFVFDHYTSEGVRWAINFALDVFADRKAWLKLMRNGMAKDFSWGTQVERYVELYRGLVE